MNDVVGRTSNLKDVVSWLQFCCAFFEYSSVANASSSLLESICARETVNGKNQMEDHLAQLWRLQKVLSSLFQKLKQFPGIKYFGGGEMEFLPFHW